MLRTVVVLLIVGVAFLPRSCCLAQGEVSFADSTLMLKRIESADGAANRYWEEYLLIDNMSRMYASTLPHITYQAGVKQERRTTHPVAAVIAERFPLSNVETDIALNRLLWSRNPGSIFPALHLRLIPYAQEIAGDDTLPVHRIGMTSESWLSLTSGLQIHLRARLENHGELYSQFSGEKWKEKITGWIDNAALYLYKNGFFGSAGRSFLAWGPEQGDALLISSNSSAFDRIWLGYEHRLFRFEYIIARLDGVTYHDSILVRYISAHRLSFRKAGVFELGLSEVALYGGYNRPVEWYYLNPLLPYYWEQWNRNSDDNIFFGADLAIYWPRQSRLFGELLVDDFQIDFESEPHQVGYKIGIDALEPLGAKKLFTKLSYTRVNTTVYGQNKPQNLYLHYGQPIGYFAGNDLDRLLLLLRYHLSYSIDLELELQYNRRGQGRIERFSSSGVPHGVKFPSGVVEESPSIGMALQLFGSRWLQGHVAIEYAHFRNYRHQRDVSRDRMSVDVYLSGYLQGLID